jgi:uncharacterized protein (DUF305 family)
LRQLPTIDSLRRAALALLLAAVVTAGCTTAQPQAAAPSPQPPASAPAADPDVHFMTGMIHHHAQAVLIAGWAVSHGGGDAVRRLCERIVVAQRDEIALMSRWLKDNGKPVPDTAHMQAGIDHAMHMPGMLTAQQLAELDQARGAEFDRLFLTYMIQHHQGALTMVEQLFGSYGGAQDPFVFKLASDISADQSAEIDRMTLMLEAMPPAPGQ